MNIKSKPSACTPVSSPDPATNARAVPIHRTASYVFDSTAHAADLFSLKEPGNIYTRIMNPTQDQLENTLAALEGGPPPWPFLREHPPYTTPSSIFARRAMRSYPPTTFTAGPIPCSIAILPQFGIHTRFVDPRDPRNFEPAINERTRAIYIEAIGNPVLEVTDIEAVAKIAHDHNLPLIVDATFTTPYLLKSIDHGADIVVHSLTKWIGGHGTGIGGVVVDAGKFNWQDEKFKLYNEPDASYHDLRFAHDLGDLNPLAFIMRMRLVPLRNLGACIAPDNAWLFLQGLETLPLRMERHSENALKVAGYLKSHPKVAWVRYPGLEDDPTHPVAKKYLKKGFGGMVVFGIKGGFDAGHRFVDKLKLFSHLANVGDAKSLVIHPSSTSHSQLSEEDQKASGLTPDLIRLSIGIEHIDDIIADLDQAF